MTNPQEIVRVIDFWQKIVDQEALRPRLQLEKINLESKEIIDLIGPRRSGKSSVLKLLIKKLNLTNNFLFINF